MRDLFTVFYSFCPHFAQTVQMDAEAVVRKTAADPLRPPKTPSNAPASVASPSQIDHPACNVKQLNLQHCKEESTMHVCVCVCAQERLLRDLHQSIPQNSCVHLHVLDFGLSWREQGRWGMNHILVDKHSADIGACLTLRQ